MEVTLRPGQLKKEGESVKALAEVSQELRQSHEARTAEIDGSAASLETPEAVELFVAKRDTAYTRMYGLLHTLWDAPDSDALMPPRRTTGVKSLERSIQAPGYPDLLLSSNSESMRDLGAEHNYGLDYEPSGGSVRPLRGLGDDRFVLSESALQTSIDRGYGDPRGRHVVDRAADFLENVHTLELLCEAAGVQISESAAIVA
jgi:hypothetical protein